MIIKHREQVLAALKGLKIEPIPWLPEINIFFAERQIITLGLNNENLDPSIRIAFEMGAASFLSAPFIKEVLGNDVQKEVIERSNEVIERITTPYGILKSRQVYNENAQTWYQHEYLIKGPQDYKAFEYYYTSRQFIADNLGFRKTIEPILDYGIVALSVPPTPYMACIMFHMGTESTMYQLFDHKKEFLTLLEVMHNKDLEYCRLLLDAPIIDIIRPLEDTSSRLSSPNTFEQICKPYLKSYAELIHSRGHLFIPHMCGHLKDMLPTLKTLEIDGIEAVTPPPTGDCSAQMIRDRLGSDMIIIGGFDPTNFVNKSQGDFYQTVLESIIPMRNDSRFIFGHEEIPPLAKWENVKIVSQILKEVSQM